MASPLIFGCTSTTLSQQEQQFFTRTQPYGFILFARNIDTPEQVRALVNQLRSCTKHHARIFIDQEGGRVARLRPPHWPEFPAAAHFANIATHSIQDAERACYDNARVIAETLTALGIDANCAPLVDIPTPGAHDIIGDRAFGNTATQVIRLASAQAYGLMDHGVQAVLKHIPGHGRAMQDSHEALPVVDTPLNELEQQDFLPFRALAHLPYGMSAHIVYTAIDAELPATLSPTVIRLIRERIGFHNTLMSDDLCMKALSQFGDMQTLARNTLRAGCDMVLHCSGNLEEMEAVATGAGCSSAN